MTSQAMELGLPFQSSDLEIQLKWARIMVVARIVAAYDIIQNTSGIFVRVRQNLVCDVMFALRLVAIHLSNCCRMQNGTLIVSMYCICK